MTRLRRAARAVLPRELQALAARLLDQQFWCWGWDIRRIEGNLLLECGFSREQPPSLSLGSSCYRLKYGSTQWLALWGFGLFYADSCRGGLCLSRFDFAPLLTPAATPPVGVWSPDQIPGLRVPATVPEQVRALELLALILRHISAYEEWVLRREGIAYRRECLEDWPRPVLQATELPAV